MWTCCVLCIGLTPVLAHRIAFHLDSMSVVDQAVEDTVRGGGIADLFVPARHRQLRGEDGRARLIAIFADFPKVAAFGVGERSHGPVVDHQDIDTAQAYQQTAQTTVGACDGQVAKQSNRARVESRVTIPAGLLRQCASNEAFTDTGRPEHEDVFMLSGPSRLLCEGADHTLVQSAGSTIVDLLYAGSLELGGVQATRQRLILAPGPLLIHQQAEPLQEA